MSIHWYVGIPESGKTHQALRDLIETSRKTGFPAIVIDDASADNFAAWPHARNLDDLFESVWGYGLRVAYTPSAADPRGEVDAICNAAEEAGRCCILIDEAATWLTSSVGRGSPLARIMRRHRHWQGHLFLTTQHFSGDVSQEALSCAPRVLIFRNESETVLDALRRRYSLDPAFVRSIPQYQFVERFTGFPPKGVDRF